MQELLAYLLDGMHEDLNRVRFRPPYDPTDEDDECDGTNDHGDAIAAWSRYLSRNQSIVVDLFQGQLRNTMICRNRRRRSSSSGDDDDDDGEYCCGHVSVKFDPIMYLSLPVSDGCDTLDDCLDLFCSEEFLTGDERWYCPRCRTHVDATKKIDLFMLPPILIVHLKRFEICPNSCRWTKIDRAVRYPLNDWNLNESTKGGGGDDGGVYPLYDLYAISHHVGDVGHGHYTSHARNRFDGAWYNFNDGRCDRIINDPTMRTEVRRSGGRGFGGSSSSSLPSAYCLFYHRVERVRGANGGDDVEKKTVIRRQSVSRPELWPHLQRAKAAEWASLRVTT
jgi:ubiquitin carboxyl-terminal hydrolase 8